MTEEVASRTRFGWVRLASVFLAGQAVVQLTNVVAGLMIVRLLPVDQYALYTVAATLLALLALAANPGISQAVITQGARFAEDRSVIAGLVGAASSMSRRLYLAMLPILVVVAAAMLVPHDWPLAATAAVVFLAAAMVWMRVPTMIATAVLNLRHDSRGLFLVGIGEGLVRVALVPLCFLWPHAVIALVAGLAGAGLARWIGQRRISPLIDKAAAPMPGQAAEIRRFIRPLAPIVVYTALQGQIAVLILSLLGNTGSIASVGAITRLGQIISIGMLLNPFLIQPIMARQVDRDGFRARVGLIVAGLSGISTALMASAFVVPGWWLWILGGSYAGLERELPVALATALLTLVGGTLYTLVISRNRTAGQYWPILPSIAGQALFVAFHGVSGTLDALVLGLIPAFAYAVVQGMLLGRVVGEWR